MSGLNRRGPLDEGPMTGRRRGFCGGGGAGRGRGGFGERGWCRGRGYGRPALDEFDDLGSRDALEQRKGILERSLKSVTARLHALKRDQSTETS